MKTSQLLAVLQTRKEIVVSRFAQQHYALRKQCKRLQDKGVVTLLSKDSEYFHFTKA